MSEFPEVPTIAETLPGYRSVTWYAMTAPPDMPAALADRINRDVNEILARKDVAERVRGIQMSPVTWPRDAAAKFFGEETRAVGTSHQSGEHHAAIEAGDRLMKRYPARRRLRSRIARQPLPAQAPPWRRTLIRPGG